MPHLDTRGIISAVEIVFYTPIALLTVYLVYRYAFRRDAGWLFLSIFSMARIAGGALLVAAESQPTKISLFSAAYIMDPAALTMLLLSTLGFLGMVGQHTYSEQHRVTLIFRFFGLLGLISLALSIAGGVLSTKSAHPSTALTLRRAGVCILAGLYVFLFLAHLGSWGYRWYMRTYRRNLLFGITVALPFMGVRMAYAVMAAWSSSDLDGKHLSSNPTLAKMNPVTGDWVLYLVLSVIMEFIVTAMYLFSSTVLSQRRH
ncbi:uncharacterized protein LACBIDRAFT_300942 [Laccaria bicolor S238N-H82]|uniref:Predicted protein n=1 Tax=Laccaria bicolor (strain S238N-H82 / ATCC MYA-4686) TaxID=486041 RepID=B0CQY3_LACBS|nr:uncharacterized protein LACBIDRAFT_300942 [Laccaria bicolor S238N-H82]EDR15717.1 predicted protein [Laccaria bicolor S238N-H82]|eukprot:XP_001873925.1 predicted protein [Laccaria bicolor S238N-H82]